MKVIGVGISDNDSDSTELMEMTGKQDLTEAVNAAVRFTLMHDKDSVQEALK